MDVVQKSRSFYQYVVSEDIRFPQPGEKNNATISYIEAIDKMPIRESGYAKILRGGVGAKNCTIRLQSGPWHSLYYIVRIFGQ